MEIVLAEDNNHTIDMQSLMESVLARLSDNDPGKPVSLVTEAPAHFPSVAVNQKRTAKIIGDLLHKIIMWTSRQEVRIQAQIVPTSSLPNYASDNLRPDGDDSREGPWALLSITDQHAGFLPGEERNKIAFPSQEALAEITGSFKQLLDEEGGVLWVEALDAGGIQVWIALPLQPESQHAADVTRIRKTVDTRLQESDEQNTKVLVQAENDPLRGMLAENLIEGGYDVITVQRSGDVLPLVRREIPDLIVLDLQSRDPSAMDLALLLRGEPSLSDAPILFLTEVVGSGIGTRMDTVDFLVQPEGVHALLETVEQVLGSGLRSTGRIMVVEGDDELREEMLQTIQSQGYPVVEAHSAEEAFALAERVNLGLVLANAGLAQARDYWLVRQLRQLSEGIDIYLMTEGPPSVDPNLGLHKGVTGYGETGRLRELLARVDEEEKKQTEND